MSFAGFDRPRYTPIPDTLLDTVMADLSGAELKVLLYLFRRTLGFQRDRDAVSLTQLATGVTRSSTGEQLDRGTGLGRNTIIAALKSLEAAGYIVSEKQQDESGAAGTTVYAPRWSSSEGVVQKLNYPGSKSELPVVQKSNQGVVQKSNPQETEEKDRESPSLRSGTDEPSGPAQQPFDVWAGMCAAWHRDPSAYAKEAAGLFGEVLATAKRLAKAGYTYEQQLTLWTQLHDSWRPDVSIQQLAQRIKPWVAAGCPPVTYARSQNGKANGRDIPTGQDGRAPLVATAKPVGPPRRSVPEPIGPDLIDQWQDAKPGECVAAMAFHGRMGRVPRAGDQVTPAEGVVFSFKPDVNVWQRVS